MFLNREFTSLIVVCALLHFSSVPALAQDESAAQPDLIVYLNEYPPSSIILEDGSAGGEWADKVRAFLDSKDITYSISIVPWKRAYLEATTKTNVLISHLDRTPARENNFHWLLPITSLDYSLIALSSSAGDTEFFAPEKLAVCTEGTVHCQFLRDYGFADNQVWEWLDDDKMYIVDLLRNKRADYMLEDIDLIRNGLRNRGLNPDQVTAVADVITITSYLAASKKLDQRLLGRLANE